MTTKHADDHEEIRRFLREASAELRGRTTPIERARRRARGAERHRRRLAGLDPSAIDADLARLRGRHPGAPA